MARPQRYKIKAKRADSVRNCRLFSNKITGSEVMDVLIQEKTEKNIYEAAPNCGHLKR